MGGVGSNNTNKLSPQEQSGLINKFGLRSNNTNKLSPQELQLRYFICLLVQIIQINLVLKNAHPFFISFLLFK